jgi:hypothetical protein
MRFASYAPALGGDSRKTLHLAVLDSRLRRRSCLQQLERVADEVVDAQFSCMSMRCDVRGPHSWRRERLWRKRMDRETSDEQHPEDICSSPRCGDTTAETRHLPDRATPSHVRDRRLDRNGDNPHDLRHRRLRGGTPGASLGFPPHLRCRQLQDLPLHRQLLRDSRSGNRARRPGTLRSNISALDRAVPTPSRGRRRGQPRLLDDDPVVDLTRAGPPRAEPGPPGRSLRRRPRRH